MTGPGPVVCAVAGKIDVPWDQTNVRHSMTLELKDEDGHPIELPGPDGALHAIKVDAFFEVGRPPGVVPGTPIDTPFAVNVGPLPLSAGGRFYWELSIDGETHEDWRVSFSTRAVEGPAFGQAH